MFFSYSTESLITFHTSVSFHNDPSLFLAYLLLDVKQNPWAYNILSWNAF